MGLITDTGRFMYENTGRRAHLMAAELIEVGVDVHEIYRRVYEDVPVRQAGAARARARERRALRRRAADDDRAERQRLPRLRRRGELLRGRRSTTCARSRAPRSRRSSATGSATAATGQRKVSLRASDDRVDVSAIARAQGGGGHRQAAGFTTGLSHDELVALPARAARRAALSRPGGGHWAPIRPTCPTTTSSCIDKPAGVTSHDVVAARPPHGCRRKTKVGHAGTLDPFATGLLLVLVGRATRVQRFLMALPKRYEAVARFGAVSTTGDPEGEIVATGRRARRRPRLSRPGGSCQRPPAYSAVKVGGRRAYALARAGIERRARPSARSRSTGSTSCGATATAARSRSSARRGPTSGA